MATRNVLVYPHPVLRQRCREISSEELQTEAMQTFIADLTETMYHHPGAVGLAACQIGEPVRILAMDSTAKTTQDRLFVMINPVITRQSQWKYCREGCLSFPDYLVTVKRAKKITVDYLAPDGTPQSTELRDFEAVILQHELDHLDGILFIDRIQNVQTDLMLRSSGEPVSPEQLLANS